MYVLRRYMCNIILRHVYTRMYIHHVDKYTVHTYVILSNIVEMYCLYHNMSHCVLVRHVRVYIMSGLCPY